MIRIRRATDSDAGAVERVRMQSWRRAYHELIPESAFDDFDETASAARLAARLAAGSVLAHVADDDGDVIGFASCGRCRDADLSGASEVYAIYVEPRQWSMGIGRRLLSAAVDSLENRPVVLWVLHDNDRARRFYELAGWSADGAEKDADLLGGLTWPEVRYRLD